MPYQLPITEEKRQNCSGISHELRKRVKKRCDVQHHVGFLTDTAAKLRRFLARMLMVCETYKLITPVPSEVAVTEYQHHKLRTASQQEAVLRTKAIFPVTCVYQGLSL